jgi:hypothetical protein
MIVCVVFSQSFALRMFMLQLCVNHTVLVETLCDSDDNVIGTSLSASSPDEVRGAGFMRSFELALPSSQCRRGLESLSHTPRSRMARA